jgi:hypothetical protein
VPPTNTTGTAALATLYGVYFTLQLVIQQGPSDMLIPSIGYTAFLFVCAIVFWLRRYSSWRR